uniref:Uncharacterized protein n=1 Tax=Oryza punctata TaxID=4537 RepID=A0A0E0M6C7_ORYPU
MMGAPDRVPGEPFAAKPSKDAEMDRILKSMEGKVLKDKGSAKKDLKQQVVKQIKDTGIY